MGRDRPGVLLVDDVPANLLALEAQLGALDCEITRAGSGNDALRALLKRDFAVMLLDVQMPDMDGYEVARYARDNPRTREVPILFVTAMHESDESRLRGYGTGAVDVLFKPIDPVILRSKVRVFLELYLGRRRLADEIEAHERTLAELEAFNYSVSHDLRAPLRPLEGFSRALLEGYADRLDDQGRLYLERIQAGAVRMGQLIEDLLELSRLGRTELRKGPVDVSRLAAAVAAELARADPGRRVEVAIAPGLSAQADPRLLRIVLENLLGNAWKFTGRTEHARVEVGGHLEGAEQVLWVRDNGAGFDAAYAHKLFEPFQRLHSTTEFQGTGIGLAIVRRIVHRHGGRVWGEPAPEGGATFYFTLG